jgi:hypothetical protein
MSPVYPIQYIQRSICAQKEHIMAYEERNVDLNLGYDGTNFKQIIYIYVYI